MKALAVFALLLCLALGTPRPSAGASRDDATRSSAALLSLATKQFQTVGTEGTHAVPRERRFLSARSKTSSSATGSKSPKKKGSKSIKASKSSKTSKSYIYPQVNVALNRVVGERSALQGVQASGDQIQEDGRASTGFKSSKRHKSVKESSKVSKSHKSHIRSCDCAQDALEDITNAATDEIDDVIPLEEETQRTLPPYIQALEHCAMEWLVALDCGCDDYEFPLDLHEKMSTYQCCCDVDAAKDVILHHINEVKYTWMLAVSMDGGYMTSVIGKICEFGRLDNILDRATFALSNILDNYAPSLFDGDYYPTRCQLEYDIYCPDTSYGGGKGGKEIED